MSTFRCSKQIVRTLLQGVAPMGFPKFFARSTHLERRSVHCTEQEAIRRFLVQDVFDVMINCAEESRRGSMGIVKIWVGDTMRSS